VEGDRIGKSRCRPPAEGSVLLIRTPDLRIGTCETSVTSSRTGRVG
jgi:hypothetical protein